jgi:hypothetical protein
MMNSAVNALYKLALESGSLLSTRKCSSTGNEVMSRFFRTFVSVSWLLGCWFAMIAPGSLDSERFDYASRRPQAKNTPGRDGNNLGQAVHLQVPFGAPLG